MRITYDAEVDAMSIVFRETPVTTKQVAEGIAIEYDREGLIAGIEVLDAVKRFGGGGHSPEDYPRGHCNWQACITSF